MTILIELSAAVICFAGSCYPALVGEHTPTGEFKLTKRYTDQQGYGGDVLQFHETNSELFAIHRPWVLRPEQQRLKRLNSQNSKDRKITSGCVNVTNEVYQKLLDCCQGEVLTIKP